MENYAEGSHNQMTALQALESIFAGWSSSMRAREDNQSGSIGIQNARWNDPYFWLVTLFYPSLYGIILPIFASLFCRCDVHLVTQHCLG